MKLLEIYLSPIDKQQFHGITSQSPVGDGSADSTLPFWDGQLDRRITLIKTLELSRGYQSAAFSDPDEQDWMIRAGLLAEDRQSFDPYYLANRVTT